MAQVTLEGKLPTVKFDNIGAFRDSAKRMQDSLQFNFLASGRPNRWTPLKRIDPRRFTQANTPLFASGKMMRSIKSDYGDNWAEAGIPNPKEYYKIHNDGGTFRHPGVDGKLCVFWMDGKLRFTYKIPSHDITIPARPYILFQQEDFDYILNKFSSKITFTTS